GSGGMGEAVSRTAEAQRMKISFAATNPCHVFPLAREIAKHNALGCYYSGYPEWKLPELQDMCVRTHSLRTNIVYGLLKVPARPRPCSRRRFVWQDHGVACWVARSLERCGFWRGLTGQCLATFPAAKARGMRTVLNPACGPARGGVRIMK